VPVRGFEGLGQFRPDEGRQRDADGGEDHEHAPPVGEAQDLSADEGRDDRGDAGDQHEGGEEAGHRHAVVQVADDRAGDHYPGRAGEPLDEAEGHEEADAGREGAQDGGEDVDGEAGEQRAPAAPPVAHGSDDELPERHAREARGERELHGGGRGVQGAGDLRQRGEVHVHRERGCGGEPAEDEGDEESGAARTAGSRGRSRRGAGLGSGGRR
jgi:hypothetical protein